jgi:hypothetical protein
LLAALALAAPLSAAGCGTGGASAPAATTATMVATATTAAAAADTAATTTAAATTAAAAATTPAETTTAATEAATTATEATTTTATAATETATTATTATETAATATAAATPAPSETGAPEDGGAGGGGALAGELPDILSALMEKANGILDEGNRFGMTLNDQVTAETCQGKLGLSPEQFGMYVSDAYASTAAISAFAHEVAIIRCKDAAAAAEVKKLAAEGFDPMQWVCVAPDRCYVVDSGEYVLLVATVDPGAGAIEQAFAEMAASGGGTAGEAVVFFES